MHVSAINDKCKKQLRCAALLTTYGVGTCTTRKNIQGALLIVISDGNGYVVVGPGALVIPATSVQLTRFVELSTS